ncbi:olfactory receptor 11H6-like protein [Cricetulus griseus]|uniref:Olfactory receptor 11H6-like protein n=1 Tax=Cricetulus griseus TaxID=10029 RepID=A0A061IKG7_CRIGR|nr:olfactory receptor 11H6-like protein [Cricetulus griseus]
MSWSNIKWFDVFLISFSCLTDPVSIWRTMLKQSKDRGHPCLISDFSGIDSNFSPFSMILASTKGCKSLEPQIIISIHNSDFRLCKEILTATVPLRCSSWSQERQQLSVYTLTDEHKDQRVLGSQNNTIHLVTEFILLGFSYQGNTQGFFFSSILILYLLTLLGNGSIVCAVKWDRRLHTPMYIFLGNFAFLEIWYVSSTIPNMLVNILSENKTISFSACFLQFYFFFSLGTTECFFLSVMAYDRYLAICRPLHYPSIMTRKFCVTLICICWVSGFLCYPVPIVLISQLPFCGPNIIDHIVCDPGPLFALACVPAPSTELLCYTFNSMIIFGPFLSILGSYTLVLRAVFRVPSGAGRTKAFSTCGSHLVVVSLFYGTLMVMYVSPTSGNPAGMQKIVTLIYSALTPLLNPLIYSLRNKDMKNALKKVLGLTTIQN